MKYLIIGGGPCGDSCAKELRKLDPESDITILTEENYVPYRRLSLTKQAWTVPFESISLKTEKQNVNIAKGVKAVSLDETNREVTGSDGKNYPYDRLLIATGISPRKLPDKGIIYLRTYDDFLCLKKSLETGRKVLVIGAGFTGLELAGELKKQGCEVTVIFPEELPVSKILPENFCKQILNTMETNGIEMINSDRTVSIEKTEKGFVSVTEKGREINSDIIVASIGNVCNIPFEEKLDCDRGIIVNSYMETNIPNVYAAGDAAVFESPLFGITSRKEFMDNAIKSGKCAAQNMFGQKTVYNPILNTFFDTFDIGYKAVGEYGMNFDVSVAEAGEGSVIFYRRDNIITGILFWNIKPVLATAIKCIEDRLTLSDEEYMYMMKLR